MCSDINLTCKIMCEKELIIMYGGERWFTIDGLLSIEGIKRRAFHLRQKKNMYDRVRVSGILLYKKKGE